MSIRLRKFLGNETEMEDWLSRRNEMRMKSHVPASERKVSEGERMSQTDIWEGS